MFKFYRICLFFASITLSYAQVGITKKNEIDIHQHAILQLDGEDNGEYRGLLLPTVNEYNDLPKKLPSEADLDMTGLLFYDKDLKIPFFYTGKKWTNDSRKTYPFDKESRFYASNNKDNTQEVVCVLVGCGHHEALKFDQEDYNNLGIERGTASIKYGAITYDFPNAKFTITEEGLYEIKTYIPSLTAGVLALTGMPNYQLYHYTINENNEEIENKLTTFYPPSHEVLGIGGGKTGDFSSVLVDLKEGDYIVARIHSPSVTVTIGLGLTALGEIDQYPREIIFTKITD
ncbi:hypothetical protein [Weeksella virosa]|uniref:Uncharacterized protein n=1 Tax=Weeksella virosa (strain ATCC 43766 / DSM 16922 / JCM 21250 / CCUG 30538 / CDC 9751 / IAM 14551 / NBRC 16016 / NCTC 11634 / CL345/78) TaxID=865938 RepID=F0P1N0_WEEVC|nr:hypothetical protein [Weeksella virosa]ADX67658.1 hypothetical protein Weevi_0948 [Weeksella virosa DSM 16922]VEH64717.1 Uncharacterised protein [Weeksella virosa]